MPASAPVHLRLHTSLSMRTSDNPPEYLQNILRRRAPSTTAMYVSISFAQLIVRQVQSILPSFRNHASDGSAATEPPVRQLRAFLTLELFSEQNGMHLRKALRLTLSVPEICEEIPPRKTYGQKQLLDDWLEIGDFATDAQ